VSARLPLALVTWIGALVAAIVLSGAVAAGIHSTSTGSTSGSGSSSGSSAVDPSEVRSTDSASLMRAGNIIRTLATISGHLGQDARVSTFVIYPGYLSVTAVRGGTEIDATDYVNGTYSQIATGGSAGSDPLLPLARINPRAPAAFLARISRVAHVAPRTVRYMVAMLDPITHRLSWSAYLIPGSHFEYLSAPGGTGPLTAYTPGGSPQTLRG
jgi:hypothetical protein